MQRTVSQGREIVVPQYLPRLPNKRPSSAEVEYSDCQKELRSSNTCRILAGDLIPEDMRWAVRTCLEVESLLVFRFSSSETFVVCNGLERFGDVKSDNSSR